MRIVAFNWTEIERLVDEYQAGEDDGSKVIKALEPVLVNTVKAGRSYSWGSFEDALQMARIYAWQAMNSFNRAFGKPFKNYLLAYVKESLKKRPTNEDKISAVTDCTDWSEFARNEREHPTTDNEHGVEELMESLKNDLTALEYQCLAKKVQGYSYAEITRETGLTKTQIDNALRRVRKKLVERNLLH